eukprot:symbB.v1.2.005923.t1/scaffold314.1/size231647/2
MPFEIGQPVLFDHPGNLNSTVLTYIRDVIESGDGVHIVPAWTQTGKQYRLEEAKRLMIPLTAAQTRDALRNGTLYGVPVDAALRLRFGHWLETRFSAHHLHSTDDIQKRARTDEDWQGHAAWNSEETDWKGNAAWTSAETDWKANAAWSSKETDWQGHAAWNSEETDWKANAAWSSKETDRRPGDRPDRRVPKRKDDRHRPFVPKCRKFSRGECFYGDQCRYLHIGVDRRKQVPDNARPSFPVSGKRLPDQPLSDFEDDELSTPEMK